MVPIINHSNRILAALTIIICSLNDSQKARTIGIDRWKGPGQFPTEGLLDMRGCDQGANSSAVTFKVQ